MMTLLISCNAEAGANGVAIQKSHISPNFAHHDLMNAMVPLMTPPASCDTGTSGVPCPQKVIYYLILIILT